jgi:hypothetical protein
LPWGKKKITFPNAHNKNFSMNFVDFCEFAHAQKPGCYCVVDVCMVAMEEGMLPVIAKHFGTYFLWQHFIFTVDQWTRMCALLQRNRLPPSLLWESSSVHYTRGIDYRGSRLVSKCPDAVTALSQIEFLWQDLDAVKAYVDHLSPAGRPDLEWAAAEVARRRQWFTGLRRAWLMAASFPKK